MRNDFLDHEEKNAKSGWMDIFDKIGGFFVREKSSSPKVLSADFHDPREGLKKGRLIDPGVFNVDSAVKPQATMPPKQAEPIQQIPESEPPVAEKKDIASPNLQDPISGKASQPPMAGNGKSSLIKIGALETNLVQDEFTEVVDWKKNLAFLSSCVLVAVGLIMIAYQGVYYWENRMIKTSKYKTEQIEAIKKQIEDMQRNIDQAGVDALNAKISVASRLLSNHISWGGFFKFLEDNTITDVYYVDFTGDTKGKYTLNARAKNYNAITEQIRVFKENDMVLDVDMAISDLGVKKEDKTDSEYISFSLKLEIKPEIFIQQTAP